MIPTLMGNNEWVVTERVSLLRGDVRVGDVVVAASKTSPGDTVVKRVLALPGECVRVRSLRDGSFRVEEVPLGHVWLQGDNYHSSQDSRDYGAMPWAMLQGRVFAVVWGSLVVLCGCSSSHSAAAQILPLHSCRWIGRELPASIRAKS